MVCTHCIISKRCSKLNFSEEQKYGTFAPITTKKKSEFRNENAAAPIYTLRNGFIHSKGLFTVVFVLYIPILNILALNQGGI